MSPEVVNCRIELGKAHKPLGWWIGYGTNDKKRNIYFYNSKWHLSMGRRITFPPKNKHLLSFLKNIPTNKSALR